MCRYQYHHYGHCQHQEFILVKLCHRASPLLQQHSSNKQEDIRTEGATVQALPDEAPSAAEVVNLVKTSALDQDTHQLINSSIHITHIILSEDEQQFAQEAERRYNDIISGGRPPEYYKAIEAQLQQVLDSVRQLGHPASSAAARLQQIHENNGQLPSSRSTSATISVTETVPLESFPALSRTTALHNETLLQSYAGAVKNSLPDQPSNSPVVRETPSRTSSEPEAVNRPSSSSQEEDHDWCVVDRSGRSNRLQKQQATTSDRHARKSLPQAWMQMNDEAQLAQSTPEDGPVAAHQDPDKPMQRTARTKGPHAQLSNPKGSSLKSKPSKPTLSRTTASKTPGYASPTKASKHRTAGSNDSVRAPSPCKPKSVRADTPTGVAALSSQQHSFGTSQRKVLPVHGRHPTASAPFSLDGACEFDQASGMQTFSGNSTRPPKKTKLDLRINIPDPSSNLIRPGSPSRVLIAATSTKYHLDSLDRVIDQAPQLAKIDKAACKSTDRAAILEPIRRRLSSVSSQSPSTVCISFRRDSVVKQSKEMVPIQCGTVAESVSYYDSEASITEACTGSETPQPATTDGPSTVATNTGSALLLHAIKQTAEAHTVRQAENRGSHNHVEASLEPSSPTEDAQQVRKFHNFQAACHSRHISCASSPERDPAVLKCGPVKTHTYKPSTQPKSSSGEFTFRATAAQFVPTPTSEEFMPLNDETPRPSRIAPPGLYNMGIAGTDFRHVAAPVLSPIDPPMFQVPLDQKIPQYLPAQFSSAFDQCPDWLPDEEWFGLSWETKSAIRKQREERGSSSDSSTGLSSAVFSNFTTSPSLSSLEPVPESGMGLFKPRWEWTGSRFGRAALPTMPKVQEEAHQSKGWDVKSAAPGWRYGWRGGDGLEISFQGDGPVAERNPNAPVNFNEFEGDLYRKDAVKTNKKGQKYGERHLPYRPGGSPQGRVREWARSANYPSVPCGNFEVVQATEHLPSRQAFSDAWCHNCFPAHM
ncbi:hypothetical protein E4T39_06289 [Aureobasidium subglaciale]|nr:hypothetical protein E4T39_06289 [Aureobasidium subglaciale]